MRKSITILFLCFALISAHFEVTSPTSRGFKDDNSELNAPCGDFNSRSKNVAKTTVADGFKTLGINPYDGQGLVVVNYSTDDGKTFKPTGSSFNVTSDTTAPNNLNTVGPLLLNNLGLGSGQYGVLQFVYNAIDDGNLTIYYQCSDFQISSGSTTIALFSLFSALLFIAF
eukprot:TRINITY_DN11810_c0_g1_i1.p1 TRINITY_DN11810_c0_g1~~TRINITY_DN11810_c0_g1_i1.p1  ORF type:complete len:170 (+),score=33.98 TRINITY_DN11810_c0_g1_i1:91-600(+)